MQFLTPPLPYRVRPVDNGIDREIGMSLPMLVEFHFENIPQEMRMLPQWVAFRFLALRPWFPGCRKDWTKLPVDPHTGEPAKTNQQKTWGTFAQTLDYHASHKD